MAYSSGNRNHQDLKDAAAKCRKVKYLNSNEFKASCPCPGHPDKNPSLSVALKGGRLVWHCFGGCDQEAVGKALGLWSEPKQNGHANGRLLNGTTPPEIDSWRYETVAGEHVEVHRKRGKGTKPWREPTGINGPYLPLDHDKLDLTKPIVITEGERDYTAVITNTSYQATCWIGGAPAPLLTDWICLAGTHVILWPDRDVVGLEAMKKLVAHLHGLDCEVWQANYPNSPDNKPDGWGAADATPKEAQFILDSAFKMEDIPDEPDEGDQQTGFHELVVPTTVEMPEYLLSNAYEVGSVSMLVGKPEHGKSNLALTEALALATGRADLLQPGDEVTQCKVGLVWCDEGTQPLLGKLRACLNHHNISDDDIAGQLFLWCLPDLKSSHDILTKEQTMKRIRKLAVESGIRILIVDSLAAAAPKAESDTEQASWLMGQLTSLAATINGAVQVLHHPRKGPIGEPVEEGLDAARGASSLGASARISRQIFKEHDQNNGKPIFRVSITKSSYRERKDGDDAYWKSLPIRPGNSELTAPVFIPTKPGNAFDGLDEHQCKSAWLALLNADDDQRIANIRSLEGWAGIVLAKHLDWDIGTDCQNDGQRSDEQKANRKRLTTFLNAWKKSGVLAIEMKEFARDNRSVNKVKCFVKGSRDWGK